MAGVWCTFQQRQQDLFEVSRSATGETKLRETNLREERRRKKTTQTRRGTVALWSHCRMGLIFRAKIQLTFRKMLFLLDFDTSCNSVLVGLTLVLALWGRKHQGNTCGRRPWFSIYRSVNQHFWGIPPERQRFLIFNQLSTGWIFIIPANQKCISSPSLWTSQVALPFDVLWRFVHWGKKKVHICTVGACKASLYESPTAYLIDFNGP